MLHALLFWNVRHEIAAGRPDFHIFYTAGKILRTDAAADMYDLAVQKQVHREIFGVEFLGLPYNHPAYEALPFYWLAALPYRTAYVLWLAVNAILLGLIVRLLWPYLGHLKQIYRPFPVLLFFAAYPVLICFVHGQDSIMLLLAFTLAFVEMKHGRDGRAGMWLGLGLFKFQFVLPMFAIWLLARRWKAVAGFLLAAALVVGTSLALTGWGGAVRYVAMLLGHASQTLSPAQRLVAGIHPVDMPNLRGLLHTSGILSPAATAIALLVISVALIYWCAGKWRDSLDVAYSLSITVAVLVSYHCLPHDLVLLILPLALLLNHALAKDRRWLIAPAALLCLAPYLLLPWPQRGHLLTLPILLLMMALSRAQTAVWVRRPSCSPR